MINEIEIKKRRDFLKKIGSIAAVGIALPAVSGFLASCEQDEEFFPPTGPGVNEIKLNLGEYPELNTFISTIKVKAEEIHQNYTLIITRTGEESFLVALNACTHNGCLVPLPKEPGGNMVCPCHGSTYSSITGEILKQPSKGSATNLKTYEYTFDKQANTLAIKF